ncbi:WhiB family transcriptional regulator [Rhodococcus sp. (in: high G+C Gram-positive bacteria)]|uniref:WhiB family transcriptional regulator n=1 Tax=Rhodococcus sp. TaxID=1831 RepID=UPI0038907DAD
MPSENRSTASGVGGNVIRAGVDTLPCHGDDPDLWFADAPSDLELAKSLCTGCPVRARCLEAALARREPWGVWGGEIINQGAIVARKRPRGRPARRPITKPRKELVCA